MRTSRLRTALLVVLGLMASSTAVAQFNPEGRRKPRPRASTAAPAPRPAAPAPATRAARTEQPSADALIVRYRAIVLAQPTATFPLQRLTELYRERDGNFDALILDFEQRASAPDASQYAALVALGGIYAHARMNEKAISALERAITVRPNAGDALLILARLYQDTGARSKAYESLQAALPRLSDSAAREQALRTLMQLALDLERWAEAERHHAELVRLAKGSAFAMSELGRELLSRGHAERAVASFERVVAQAAGDNRALVPALRDLGGAQLAAEDFSKSIATLDRAAKLARGRPGERREILGLLARAHRSQGQLGAFLTLLEREGSKDALEQEQLGRLYEEVGRLDDALTTYRASLKRQPGNVDTRLKVIRLLQLRGDLDAALNELRRLVREAPRSPEYVFQLTEALLAHGDRSAAVAELERLEARSVGNEDILAALVDFYERVGEKQRALALLQRLARLDTRDPMHVIELGNRYWRDNQPGKARETWERVRTLVPDQGRAQELLGEVYLEHDLTDEALEAFRLAVKASPGDPRRKRALAVALERAAPQMEGRKGRRERRDEAARIWQELLSDKSVDPTLAREARQHLVSSWHLERTLTQRIAALEGQLRSKPPNAEAGRLLAEAWLKLKKPREAAQALEAVIALHPGDLESLARLERAYADEGRVQASLKVLERLAKADPKRAREYYQRMADLAARIYDDKLALSYARRVVELQPDDSASHQRLAALYLQTQDYEGAIAAYRQAILTDGRAMPVYLDLADLLIARQRQKEASDLLLRVILEGSDDELVARAARTSFRIHLGQGDPESVEHALLSQSLNHPTRPVFRRLLIELYGAEALPFMHAQRFGTPAERDEATKHLRAMGQRATKPLLDALGDTNEGQRHIALQLLGYMENPSAGPAVITLARATTDPELAERALEAVAAMRSPSLLPKLTEILFPNRSAAADESDPLVAGAARAVGLMGSKAAEPLLLRMLGSDSALLRGWGALGLGLVGERSHVARLRQVTSDPELGPVPQAAAAFALGELGASPTEGISAEREGREDPLVAVHVTWSLARSHSSEARSRIATLLLSESERLTKAGVTCALDLVRATRTETSIRIRELVSFKGTLGEWLSQQSPPEPNAELALAALTTLAPELARATQREAETSPERAVAMARLWVGSDGTPTFAPLARFLPRPPAPGGDQARETLGGVVTALVPSLLELASHPKPEYRIESVRALAAQRDPTVIRALVATLQDGDEQVQRAALDSIARHPAAPELVDATVRVLQDSGRWSIRARALDALGSWQHDHLPARALSAMVDSLRYDEAAWVREAAARAVSRTDDKAARAALARQAELDPEPRVRDAIRALLKPD